MNNIMRTPSFIIRRLNGPGLFPALSFSGSKFKRIKRSRCLSFVSVILFQFIVASALASVVPGFIPGELSVTPSGSASYSVPISVPAGAGNMQPSLSFNYSSQGGNGPLGIGWSLGGLSAISRCPATLAQDNRVGGINFDTEDRYCLDGQRLIAISGDDGKGGTEYRTEIESFSKVISYGTSESNPTHWKVWTKSGQTIEYGNTTDSDIKVPGKSDIYIWKANKIIDAAGNAITLSYFGASSENAALIERIDYANNQIKFTYETRTDQRFSYIGGGKVSLNKRLASVATYHNNSKISQYNITYKEEPAEVPQSRITEINQCSSNGDCFPATNFTWEAIHAPSFKQEFTSGLGGVYFSKGSNGKDMGTRIVDLNGDGLPDILQLYLEGGTAQKKALINTGSGFVSDSAFSSSASNLYFSKSGLDYGTRLGDFNGDGLPDLIQMASSNGEWGGPARHVLLNDGTKFVRDDLFSNSLPSTWFVYGGTSYGSRDFGTRLADINGDGRTDFIQLYYSGGSFYSGQSQKRVYLSTGTRFIYDEDYSASVKANSLYFTGYVAALDMGTRIADANGDGLPDLIQIVSSNGEWGAPARRVLLNDGSKFVLDSDFSSSLPSTWFIYGGTSYGARDFGTRLADINGDGKADIIQLYLSGGSFYGGTPQKRVYLSTGTRFIYDQSYSSSVNRYDMYFTGGLDCQDMGTRIADINGDGLVDLIQMFIPTNGWYGGQARRRVYLNTGKGFEYSSEYTDALPNAYFSGGGADMGTRLADLNGDGTADFFELYGSPPPGWFSGSSQQKGFVQPTIEHRIKTVTTGLGEVTQLHYRPLTDTSVYEKGGDAAYPEIDIQAPYYVVSKIENDNGQEGWNSTDYKYGPLKVHARGRGLLGFAWMKATNNQTAVTTTTSYSQTFPYVGSVLHTEQRLDDGSEDGILIGETEVTKLGVINSYSGKVYFPYVENSEERKHDLNGDLLATITTTNDLYDDYGNPKHIKVETKEYRDSGTVTETKETTNTYYGDGAIITNDSWILGRLETASVTHTNAEGSITRASSFEYYEANDPNGAQGLLKAEIVEPELPNIPSDPRLKLRTEYKYDGFGNKTETTTSYVDYDAKPFGILNDAIFILGKPASITSTTTYDSDGRYPATVANALEQFETHTYDPKLGGMTSLIGPNGLKTEWKYDSFGRKTREDRADGTWTTITRGMCGITDCPLNAPMGTVLYTITESSGSAPVTTYSDKLGRVTRKETIGFDGFPTFEDTEYNELGQVERASTPYYSGEQAIWRNFTYDDIGRVKRITQPGVNGRTVVTENTYTGFKTEVIHDLGDKAHKKTTIKNAQGKVIRVEEEEGGLVTYKYDATGNLLETDAGGIVTKLRYDVRGRKTFMDDPDMGEWNYSYNALGQLVTQTDAKGQVTFMGYDELGRMTKRLDDLHGALKRSSWIYGDDKTAHNVGKLIQVESSDYLKTITYDDKGRPKESTTAITSTSDAGTSQTESFTQSTSYDTNGRVKSVTRPEGFVLENRYNQYGYLESIRAPKQQIGDYDSQHLSDTWEEIRPELEIYLEIAQQQADELGAKAAIYKARAKEYGEMAALLVEESPNKEFLKEDRQATVTQLQQAATTLTQLAESLEQKAAEYQKLANAILSFMPIEWQDAWFTTATAHYDQKTKEILQKITDAYAVNENTLVWVPIQVAGITTFIQAKPGFYGRDVVSDTEENHLEAVGNWEANSAELLRRMAADARAQQQAKDKYDTALANHPETTWVPISVGDITTFIEIPTQPLTPADALTASELDDYNAEPLNLKSDVALVEYYQRRSKEQKDQQIAMEELRTADARTARRLNEVVDSYTEMVNDYAGETGEIIFWRATERDAAGRLSAHVVGNGLETRNVYDQTTGQLTDIFSAFGYSETIRHLSYRYDNFNNVRERRDHVLDITEGYDYDDLDRLTSSTFIGQIAGTSSNYNYDISYAYDSLGNLMNKSDLGSSNYEYGNQDRDKGGNAGPHAVIHAGENHGSYGSISNNYSYDNNGNMLTGDGRTIAWTSFNKPESISKNGAVVTFKYGPDRARYYKESSTGSKTLYLGGGYERVVSGTKTEHKYYIHAEGKQIAIHTKTTDTAATTPIGDKTNYLHYDALGSVDTITNGQGEVVDRLIYEPFGKRRFVAWKEGIDALVIPTATNRGFTGHEHIDELDLIHMNGRVYDPTIGRFLSADPTMQFPHASQGFNRYSYVQNNPLKYTDPSGFGLWSSIKKLFKSKVFRIVVAAVAAYFTFGAVFNALYGTLINGMAAAGTLTAAAVNGALAGSFALAAAAGGFVSGVIATGSVKQGFKMGLIAGLTAGAGSLINTSAAFGTVGKFTYERAIAKAVLGGVSSELGGGKFANGAGTATFAYIVTYADDMWNNDSGTLYEVNVDQRGVHSKVVPSDTVGIKKLFVNGQSNDVKLAIKNGYDQLGSPSMYHVYHNPTHTGLMDTIESALGSTVGPSNVSRQLSDILARNAGTLSMVAAHSQGTIMVSNALELIPGQLSNNTTFSFFGPAAPQSWTRRAVAAAGGSYGQWKSHNYDFVGNIIGGGARNAGQWVGSVAAFPLLFTKNSPHSTYYP